MERLLNLISDRRRWSLLAAADGTLTEHQGKELLAAYGIPITEEEVATSEEHAVGIADRIGYPVALKIDSPDILHKTEAGGIALNLDSDDEVRRAYDEVVANAKQFAPGAEVQGVLVQEMLGEGTEVIVGMTKDPVFGPVIMFGLGGIFVEALRDVSFTIPRGKRYALAGVTGGGKSTVINLLLRFYDVSCGRVLVDGVDVRETDLAVHRARFGLVMQDPFLFSGSVKDNVALARPDLTPDEFWAAARAAEAAGFIRALPQGPGSGAVQG